MKRQSRILIAALFIAAFAITSCSVDYETGKPDVPYTGETAEITFLADLPSATPIATRATGTESENKIEDLHVLVFDKTSKNLIYKSGRITNPTASGTNNNKVTFKATLPVGKEYNFMVLTNTGTLLNGITVGANPVKTKEDVLNITKEETGNWDLSTQPIPMWGEITATLTASSTPTFELTRMLARINVEFSPRTGAKDNFKLTSIRYYNYNAGGAIAPDVERVTNIKTTPTIPTSITPETGDCLLYTDIKDNKSCEKKIYVFEAAHNGKTYNNPPDNTDWIDNPCLVIGGKYTTDDGKELQETFYRIDFIRKEKDEDDPGIINDVWLSVLRNFSYNVAIVEVNGAGYDDHEVALKSAPINMEANVLDWDERDMGEIVFDGMFYLSVSQDEFVFERGEVTTQQDEYTLYVKTDYIYNNDKDHEKSGWYVEKYVDGEDEETPVTWLKLNPDKGSPNNLTKAHFTFEENPHNTNRKAIVWIAAGRLRYPVYITQRVLSLYITDPDNNNEQVSQMFFVVPRDFANSPARQFRVNWTPVDHDVDITMESPQVWNPFRPDWLNPNPENLSPSLTIPGNPGGSYTFTVNPPPVSQSEIGLDPFYQKETTYSFTVRNGSDEETKSINIQQIYYNIIVDTYTYELDGKTYTLSVRSNAEWRISKIEEWLYNTEPDPANPHPTPVMLRLNNYDNLRVGTEGGPNTTGESVAFTVVNNESDEHKNKWGTVYVTFENPDNKFDPVTVAINFPPESMTVLGIGYGTGDQRAFNVAKPSIYHSNSLYDLLINPNNFGIYDDSKVKIRKLILQGQNAQGLSIDVTNDNADSYQMRKGYLQDWINKYNPGVIAISYSVCLREIECKLILEYLERGGAVIMYYGGDVQTADLVEPFFSLLFNKTLTTGTNNDIYLRTYSRIFKTEDIIDDPVLNGPFGYMGGKLWGSHLNTVSLKESVIADDVHILSRTDSEQNYYNSGANDKITGYVNMFRHKKHNLFWIGNAMGTATSYHRELDIYNNLDPCYVVDSKPAIRPRFGRGAAATYAKYDVYNSFIFANAMAWAISVTNHTPPTGGYAGYSAADY